MATLFVVLIVLAGYHFIMESLVLPVFKDRIRFKLSALRLRLGKLKISEGTKFPESVFNDIDKSIVFTHNCVDHFNTVDFLLNKSKLNNDVVKEEAEKELSEIERYGNRDLDEILNKYLKYVTYCFGVNMGAWFIYLLPILLIALCIKKITKSVLRTRRAKTVKLAYVLSERRQHPNEDMQNGLYTGNIKTNSPFSYENRAAVV